MTVVVWCLKDNPGLHNKIKSLPKNQGKIWGGHHSSVVLLFFPLHIPRDLTPLYSFNPFFLLGSLSSLDASLCVPILCCLFRGGKGYHFSSSWDPPLIITMLSYSSCARTNCIQSLAFKGKAKARPMNLCEAICSPFSLPLISSLLVSIPLTLTPGFINHLSLHAPPHCPTSSF